jgi:hypothetical protein
MKMFFAAILTVIFGTSVVYDVATWRDFVALTEQVGAEITKEWVSTSHPSTGDIPDPGYEVKMLEYMPPQFAMVVLMKEMTPAQVALFNNKESLYGRNVFEMRMMVARLNIIVHEFKTNPYSRNNVTLQVEYDQFCEEVARHWRTLKAHTDVMPKTFRDYLKYHKAYSVICSKIS